MTGNETPTSRERELKAKFAPRPKPTSQTTSNPNGFQMDWKPSSIMGTSYFKPTEPKTSDKELFMRAGNMIEVKHGD